MKIGTTIIEINEPIKRCDATLANTQTGKVDVDTLGALNNMFGHQNFGVYASFLQGRKIETATEWALI